MLLSIKKILSFTIIIRGLKRYRRPYVIFSLKIIFLLLTPIFLSYAYGNINIKLYRVMLYFCTLLI